MKRILILTALVLTVWAAAAEADDVEEGLASALAAYKQGDLPRTGALLNDVAMMLNNNREFKIREMRLCSAVNDFRDYTPLAAPLIKATEPLLAYIEPEGYRIIKQNDGYAIHLSEDIRIIDEKGGVVFEKNDWLTYQKSFPQAMIPFFITNRLTDIPAGKYKLEVTIKDHQRQAFIRAGLDFSVE